MACENEVCCQEIFLNDEGTSIQFEVYTCDENSDPRVETGVDISAATAQLITFLKPDGVTTVPKSGSFLTDGTDFISHYVTEADFLDEIGTWKAQNRITLPGGKWYTSIISFKVVDIL